MNPKTKKLITRIGTGVIFIAVGIIEYKFSTLPLAANVAIDLAVTVAAYFGISFILPKA